MLRLFEFSKTVVCANKSRIQGLRYVSTSSRLAEVAEPKTFVASPELGFFKTPKLLVGHELEGFVVQEVNEVPEFHLTAARLVHSVTGAQYLHIYRDDNNNAFSVGFRTTPQDSTGLPHILEHTTLCGSVRYPCRDPFFKMINRSLATFMNAMTGPDYTMYPFSTQNPHDFNNLLSVYLDAVFQPQLRESDFRQEGWRLEHEDPNDPNTPVVFKGVVFNEMKGVFSENQSLFGQHLLNNILPSHTYGYVSGGDPLAIPNLTHEDLKAFHAKFYNPSNARFYSYGNFSLVDHLIYINQNYLTCYESVTSDAGMKTEVPAEKQWSSGRRKHIACRIDPMAPDPKKQSTIAVSTLCTDITNIQATFELQVVSELLVKGPNSPFYKSLVEPNIGAGFSPVTGYDAHTKDTFFTVGLQGLNSSDFERVLEIYNSTIDNVIKGGFDEKHVEAVLHGIELSVKHQSTDFGLGLLFGLTPLWNHDGDLIKALHVNDQVSELRYNMKNNPKYLQNVVEKFLKGNPHQLILSMTPEESYDDKQSQAEKELLKSKLSSLSEKDKKNIYKLGLALLEEQQKSTDPNCLPTLHISDLKSEVDVTPLTETKFESLPVQVCLQPTNGITYFRGVLNTSGLTEELKSLVPLFNHVLPKMGTTEHDYRELDQLIQLKTGGLAFTMHVAEDTKDIRVHEEGILISSYCLDRNTKDMFELISEVFKCATLEDVKRFDTLVRVSAAQLVNGITHVGHHYAVSCASGLVNGTAYRKELSGGLSYVGKMRQLAQMSDLSDVLAQIREIASRALNKEFMRCAINLSPENQSHILKDTESFIHSLSGNVKKTFLQTAVPEVPTTPTSVHHVLPIPVNYTAKSVSAVSYRDPDFAPLRVLARLLTSKYLHPLIREKGGAYGSGANVSAFGTFNFYSYRDPNSTLTFDTFDAANCWVSQDKFSKQDIEEAKLGVFQNIDAPVPPGSKGMNNFLFGVNDVILQNHRKALMTVSREDIIRVSESFLGEKSKLRRTGYAIIGPENSELMSVRKHNQWKVIVQE